MYKMLSWVGKLPKRCLIGWIQLKNAQNASAVDYVISAKVSAFDVSLYELLLSSQSPIEWLFEYTQGFFFSSHAINYK